MGLRLGKFSKVYTILNGHIWESVVPYLGNCNDKDNSAQLELGLSLSKVSLLEVQDIEPVPGEEFHCSVLQAQTG